MKALVISDSHGAVDHMKALMQLAETSIRPDALIYCGDGLADVLPHQKAFPFLWAVRGNCDVYPRPDIPLDRTERLGGVWVYVAHGHSLRVKQGLLGMHYRAQEVGAAVACFGHTHQPVARWEGGILLLNPGALRDGRYAVLHIEPQGDIRAELLDLV